LISVQLHSRRGAYAALVVLTVLWGFNWLVLKFALQHAHPVVLNVHRTWLAVLVLFAALILQRRPLLPSSWIAIAVTGLFQTTINIGSTTMALAGGGAGRTSVLVYTMPFWTMLIAWLVLHERVKRSQWSAVGFAFAGLALVVEPWNWQGDIGPKLWAVLSGFGWGAGTVLTKHFQRARQFDPLNFLAWQMLVGVLPLTLLPIAFSFPATLWSATYVAQLAYISVLSTSFGFLLWIAVLRVLPAGTASLNMFAIPVIALLGSMAVFDEKLTGNEWAGIACIGVGLAIVAFSTWRASRRGETDLTAPTPLDGG
jgi:drug/metabolite transporter (DMT)-like permease